ncbi:MAG: hypothetical protein ACXVZ1_11450 [Gaiellaceae bacterium]
MSTLRTPRIMVLAALAALGALVVASTGALAQSQSASKAGAVVSLRNTAVGDVLAGTGGRTVYMYAPDKKNTSTCYGQCASFWPPYLTSGKPRAGKGVKASLLGQTTRKDGKRQVTYAGHPLYFFAKDSKAGETNGQSLQDIWWTVSPSGRKDSKKPAPTPQPAQTAVQLGTTSLGSVLTDSSGMTLYMLAKDSGGTSNCYGQCASFWPPLAVNGNVVAGTGVNQSLLGATQRTDGTLQVTYNDHPLYHFVKDTKAGDTNGEGVQGVWFVLSAAGDKA